MSFIGLLQNDRFDRSVENKRNIRKDQRMINCDQINLIGTIVPRNNVIRYQDNFRMMMRT